MKTKILLNIKRLKNGENFAPKWTSKKAFLKTHREHFLVFLGNNNPSRQVLWQWNFFLMIRAFAQWLSECHTMSHEFSVRRNPKFCVLHKKLRGLQNPAHLEIMVVASSWNHSFFLNWNASKMIYRFAVTIKHVSSLKSTIWNFP